MLVVMQTLPMGRSLNLQGQPQPETTTEQATSGYAQYGQYTSPQQSPNYIGQTGAYTNYLSQSAPTQRSPFAQPQLQYQGQYYAATTTAPSASSRAGGHAAQQERRIKGTPGRHEKLNREYKVQRDGKEFFRPGRVFKIYWSEPKGHTAHQTTLTDGDPGIADGRFGQKIWSKIRWFMVISTPKGEKFSSCLPIQTYGGQGVAKYGITKCYHSIIHTSSRAPQPTANELPNPNPQPGAAGVAQPERAMLSPIRVEARKKSDIMDEMARLNYIKIYAVEHNVKVYDFGMVSNGCMPILKASYKWVQQMGDEDEEDENDDDDGDEDDDDDDQDEEEEDDSDEPHGEPVVPTRSGGKQVTWEEKPRARRQSSARDQGRPEKDSTSKSSSGRRKRR